MIDSPAYFRLNHSNDSVNSNIIVHINQATLCITCSLNALVLIMGAICNCLVILTILRTNSLKSSSINRAVLSLCLADLLTVFIDVPLTLTILLGNYFRYMPWSETALCEAQTFAHTLSTSTQIMAFPVIGMERYFSISKPFDKVAHIKRINILSGVVWLAGLVLALVAVFLTPVTTVSLYCDDVALSGDKIELLYWKIFCITIPLGVVCLIVTVICYGLIVWRVRKQNKKSLASKANSTNNNNATSGPRRRRARSHSGPINYNASPILSRRMTASKKTSLASMISASSEAANRVRRKSLQEFKQRRKLSSRSNYEAGSVRKSPTPSVASMGSYPRRPLKKQIAVDKSGDEEEHDNFDENGLEMKHLSIPSPNVNANNSPPISSLRRKQHHQQRAVSLSSSSSNYHPQIEAIDDYDDDFSSSVFSNSVDKTNNNLMTSRPQPTQRISVAVMTTTPVIAITAPDDGGRCAAANNRPPSPPASSKRPERRSGAVLVKQLAPPMRRAKSALSRTPSIESDMSVLSSPIVMHESDGRIKIYDGRHRSMPRLMRASVVSMGGQSQNRRRTEAKTAKKSSYIVLTFLVIWLPLPVCVGLSHRYLSLNESYERLQKYLDLQLTAFCFGMLTVVTNPIIYGLAIKSFRVAFKKLMRSDWNRMKAKLGLVEQTI